MCMIFTEVCKQILCETDRTDFCYKCLDYAPQKVNIRGCVEVALKPVFAGVLVNVRQLQQDRREAALL